MPGPPLITKTGILSPVCYTVVSVPQALNGMAMCVLNPNPILYIVIILFVGKLHKVFIYPVLLKKGSDTQSTSIVLSVEFIFFIMLVKSYIINTVFHNYGISIVS